MRDTRPRRHYYFLIVVTLACILFGSETAHAKCTPMGESIRADFDGDGIHDIASGSISDSGFTYFVKISNSKGQARSLLTADIFLSSGFRLIPSDVDLDGDADLVLSRGLILPVAVWANDGRGYFTKKPTWDLTSGFNALQPGFSLPPVHTDCTQTTDGKRISAPVSASLIFDGNPSVYETHDSSRQISRSAHRLLLRGPPPFLS